MSDTFKTIRLYWRQVLVVIIPVVLSPLVLPHKQTSSESKCLFLVLLTVLFWIMELLPLPMTALLSIALRSILGLSAAKDGIKAFFSDISVLLVGSIIVGIAMETTMLHKRIAYMALYKIGLQPKRLLFGIMLITGSLSMWISNTSATALMLPITRALLQRLYADETGESESENRIESESNEKGGGQNENEDEGVNHVDTGELENFHEEFDNRGQFDDVERPFLSCDTATDFGLDKHKQTRQKLDEILSRRHKESTDNLALDTLQEHESQNEDGVLVKQRELSYQDTLTVFSLAIAYSANIGGIATLIGSPPNLLLNKALSKWSDEAELSFAQWSSFCLPCSLILLLLAYIWTCTLLFGIKSTVTCSVQRRRRQIQRATAKLKEELDAMGPLKYNEKTVLVHFIGLVILWLTRRPGFVTGWSALFPDNSINDSSVAVAVAISLFVFTNERPAVLCFRTKGDERTPQSVPSLLTWKDVGKKFPWGVIILIGGASVLVETMKVSGLAESIATYLLYLSSWPNWLVCLLLIVSISFATELCSNSVIVILALPPLRDLTSTMGVHPLYLMFPACITASMAFMLPAASLPNTIVFSESNLKISQMAKAGFVMNMISVLVIFIAVHTWGQFLFPMDTIPDWAQFPLNTTTDANNSIITSDLWPPEVTPAAFSANQSTVENSINFL